MIHNHNNCLRPREEYHKVQNILVINHENYSDKILVGIEKLDACVKSFEFSLSH